MEQGVLVDTDILSIFSEVSDIESVKIIIEKIKNYTNQKIISKSVFDQNKDKVKEFFLELPKENQEKLEQLSVKLGLSIEISRRDLDVAPGEKKVSVQIENAPAQSVKILSHDPMNSKKLEVNDFVVYFRNRFDELRKILQEHAELTNLVSINKISGSRQNISVIGLVSDIRKTKNGNLLMQIEDLTGKINVLVNKDKKELFEEAEKITLDSVIGFGCSGSKEILFVNSIVFPDARLPEKKHANVEEYAVFAGDLHLGSKLFMEENFLKFIDYLNGKVPNTPEVEKIKYLFLVGDLVTGIGNYPNQENEILLTDLESQFERVSELLGKIRSDIQIIISPGNHDGVRLMEPQPLLNEKYAWQLYNMKNVVLTQNPCVVNIGTNQGFSGFNVLTYHGFSLFHYGDNINYLMRQKATHAPELIMKYLLKNRHLAPTHASTQYFPGEKDAHLIRQVPDIFVAGHTHKSAVSYYNNILVVSVSGWEAMTPYMEKRGAKPDFCKVPLVNLKTRAVKILDFE